MSEALQFLYRHGYAVLFAFVFAEQASLPVPALPVLLAAGALVGADHFSLGWALLTAAVAALLPDLLWYELGRRRGHAVLHLMCRISLEPASCVRRAEDSFARYGPRALLFAKFVPGLSTMAPPMAGMVRMRLWRFLVCDFAGALLWAGSLIGLGYLFSPQLERVAANGLRLGGWLVVLLAGGLAGYIAWKYIERERFIRRLRVARIAPEELLKKLETGEELLVIDLRHSLDHDGFKLPGAVLMLPEELEQRHQEIPRDRDIVLYCT